MNRHQGILRSQVVVKKRVSNKQEKRGRCKRLKHVFERMVALRFNFAGFHGVDFAVDIAQARLRRWRGGRRRRWSLPSSGVSVPEQAVPARSAPGPSGVWMVFISGGSVMAMVCRRMPQCSASAAPSMGRCRPQLLLPSVRRMMTLLLIVVAGLFLAPRHCSVPPPFSGGRRPAQRHRRRPCRLRSAAIRFQGPG